MALRAIAVALHLDDAASASAKEAARRRGITVSDWLREAIERQAGIDRGLEGVREYEAACGAFTDEELAAADAVLDGALGISPPRQG